MELLERFASGDLDAFETLFRQYQGLVYAWTVRMVRDRGAAEDLTVETFWRIYRAHARFEPVRDFGAWARRVATNAALDYLKTARREVELPANLASDPAPDAVQQQEVGAAVRRAFGELPATLRATATLALIEERPYAEIAEALGISVGGVKTRVFRAVRQLRKKLQSMGVEP